MDEIVKSKVTKAVEDYKKFFVSEYDLVCKTISQNRELLKNDYANIPESQEVKRVLFEIPETLHNMLLRDLTQEELTHWKDSGKLGVWFARKFREFSPAYKI